MKHRVVNSIERFAHARLGPAQRTKTFGSSQYSLPVVEPFWSNGTSFALVLCACVYVCMCAEKQHLPKHCYTIGARRHSKWGTYPIAHNARDSRKALLSLDVTKERSNYPVTMIGGRFRDPYT